MSNPTLIFSPAMFHAVMTGRKSTTRRMNLIASDEDIPF